MKKGNRDPGPATGIIPAIAHSARERRKRNRDASAAQDSASHRRNDLTPRLSVKLIAVDQLRPAKRAIRKVSQARIAQVANSISQFGFCLPILIDKDGRLVAGHAQWEAAKQLGVDKVPCIEITHLEPAELRTLRIALNRLGETGDWDFVELREEIIELLDEGIDLCATGFERPEIDGILISEEGVDCDEERLPSLPSAPVSRPGDVWAMGNHLLVQADALDASAYPKIIKSDDRLRFALTDVPYNVLINRNVTSSDRHREFAMASGEMTSEQFEAFNQKWMQIVVGYLVEGGILATTIDWRSVELVLRVGRELGLDLLNLVVWTKTNAGQGSLYRSAHELLPLFKKGKAPHINNVQLGRFGRWRSNVWEYPGASSIGSDAREGLAVHPTVKPRAMLEDALLDLTNRADLVLDCFCGSGSTLLACETTGRRCRAIEIDGAYCDVTLARWEDLTGKPAVLVETGETFGEVRARRGLCTDKDDAAREREDS